MENKKTIIFADDENPDMHEFTAHELGRKGYNTELVLNGKEALRRVQELGVDNVAAVVTDGNMPFMDGVTLTKELRQISADLPVFLVSANPDMRDEGVKHGAEPVEKPFGLFALVARIDMKIRQREKTNDIRVPAADHKDQVADDGKGGMGAQAV